MLKVKTVALAMIVGVICAPATLLWAADDTSSGPAMALRLTELAQRALHAESAPSNPAWREAIAALKAARELDPTEPRYLRLLADAQIAIHDQAGALETLTALRTLQRKTQQEDQVAQLEYIDLVIDRMQTVDEKLKYLRGLVPNDAISPEVRSAAAWRCAVLLNEKKQATEADEMVSQALTLNPVNWPALYYRFQQTTASGSHPEHFDALLALMRSNPCNPELVFQVAQELAAAGLVADALKWYEYAGRDWAKMRQNAPMSALLEVSSEMFLGDQSQQAQPILDSIISIQPDNYPALVLRLLIEKNGGTKEVADKLKNQARNALINDVAIVRGKLGVKEATTQPIAEGALPAPDLGGDVVRVKETSDPRLRDTYLQNVGNLAWFELYFNGQTIEAERLLGVIRAVADPQNQQTSTFIARMEGWLFLLQGNKPGEAKVKLSAAAEKDPFAALGLVRLYADEDKAKARAEAAKLLSANSSGMLGAMLYHDLRELGVKVAPREDAPKLKASLDKFPRDWMRVIDEPGQFYMLRGDPVKISQPYGEALWVKVSIQNIGDYDLTIADDGLIKPGLWFDVQLTGLANRALTGVAFERITERIVLKPHQSITKTVRIDQGMLSAFLSSNPGPPVAMRITVRTNPLPVRDGMTSGPGGLYQELPRGMERSAFAPNDETIGKVTAALQGGDAREKMRSIELLAALGTALRAQKEAAPEVRAKGESLIEVIRKARFDTDPNVRAWAGYVFTFTGPEVEREPNVQKMMVDDAWISRLLGLACMANLSQERQKQFVKEVLEKDTKELVKDFAKAAMEMPPPRPPTTQPAQNP